MDGRRIEHRFFREDEHGLTKERAEGLRFRLANLACANYTNYIINRIVRIARCEQGIRQTERRESRTCPNSWRTRYIRFTLVECQIEFPWWRIEITFRELAPSESRGSNNFFCLSNPMGTEREREREREGGVLPALGEHAMANRCSLVANAKTVLGHLVTKIAASLAREGRT